MCEILLFITVVCTLRMFIESIFCYAIYTCKDQNINFQKCNIKKMVMFCSVHVTILSLYRLLFTDFVTYRLISVLIIFAYFWVENRVENKKFKKSHIKNQIYILTFSIFISLLTECSFFIGYTINRSGWQWLKIYDVRYANFQNSLLYYAIQLTLHFSVMFLVYKFNFIRMKDIRNLSIHKEIPILFGLCLSTVIYIKYNYQLIDNKFYQDILIGILLFTLPIYLGFYWNSCKLTRLKNIDQNHILDAVIENMVRIPIYCAAINIKPLAYMYEKDRIIFKKKLKKLGIDHGYKGYSQLVLSLIIVNHFEGDNLNFETNVFQHVSRFTGTESRIIYNNINSIIQKIWFQETSENLKYGYSYVDSIEDNPPTVNDFLINIAKKPV